jgi:hypothetical protein
MTDLTIYPLTHYGQQTGVAAKNMTEDQSTSFADMLEMVNPLQHLPVVSHFYRAETGNDIPALAKVIGSGLMGGVVGAAGSAALSLFESINGESILQAAAKAFDDEVQHQPFATSNMQAFALNPDNSAIYDEQMVAALNNQPSNNQQPQTTKVTTEEAGLNLRNLRKSEIGLPEYGIEAQFQAKLDKLLNDYTYSA